MNLNNTSTKVINNKNKKHSYISIVVIKIKQKTKGSEIMKSEEKVFEKVQCLMVSILNGMALEAIEKNGISSVFHAYGKMFKKCREEWYKELNC